MRLPRITVSWRALVLQVALLLVLAHAMGDYGHLPDGWPELLLATLDPAGSKAGSKEAAEPVRKRPRPS